MGSQSVRTRAFSCPASPATTAITQQALEQAFDVETMRTFISRSRHRRQKNKRIQLPMIVTSLRGGAPRYACVHSVPTPPPQSRPRSCDDPPLPLITQPQYRRRACSTGSCTESIIFQTRELSFERQYTLHILYTSFSSRSLSIRFCAREKRAPCAAPPPTYPPSCTKNTLTVLYIEPVSLTDPSLQPS